jgi:hypothetical protein
MKPYHALSTALVAAYTALVVAVPAYDAEARRTHYPQPTPAFIAGCHLTHSWEDGTRMMDCPEDGSTIVYDPDGLGPYCPRTDKRFDAPSWHAVEVAQKAQKHCTREIKKAKR